MPSNTYDLVCLGDDLATLVCAALCARRGMRTLVLGDDRPTRYALGPYKLPAEPAIWPTHWPARGGSAADRVLKELHAELALRRKLREGRITGQLITPDARIDLGADYVAGELARELGSAGELVLGQWQRGSEIAHLLDPLLGAEHAFPGVGFFERREIGKLADDAEQTARTWWDDVAAGPHASMLGGLAAVAFRHPNPPPLAVARALDGWYQGVPSLRGDGDSVRELLIEKLTTAGGEVRAGTVAEAVISWGKISTIRLTTGDEIGVGQMVSSHSPHQLAGLLGKKSPRRLSELAATTSIVGYRYALNLLIDQAGIPEHMAPTAIVLAAPDDPPIGDAAFSIHLSEADDAGRVVATIAAVLPPGPGSEGVIDGTGEPADPDRMAAPCGVLRSKLWKRLDEVMPFFEQHLILAHSPFEATPPYVPGGRGSYDVPRNLPVAMTPIWSGTTESPGSLGAVPYMTGLKNLTLTGDQILPTLGTEGSLVAGWSTAKVVCALAGKKKDYLRDEVVGAA